MKKNIFTICFCFLFLNSNISYSQGFLSTIKGKVIDKKTKETLIGVNIQILGTYLGSGSGVDGRFTLKKIPLKKCSLRFSMIGYKTKEVLDIELELGSTVEIPVVKMESTVIGMNPIIVTASKQQQDLSVIPHSVSVLPEIELVERAPLRLDDALESVSGVHFIEDHINIRGSSGYTWGGIGSRVLLVVDEVPMMNSDNNEINWNILPVMDVEQIEVIKGAGSALYGSNALGGVVNVITKTPSEVGRLKIRTVSGFYTDPTYNKWKWTARTLNFSRNDISYSKKFGDLGINFAFGYHKSTGYRTDDEFYRINASGKILYRFPDASKLTFYGSFSREDRNEFIEWQDQHNAEIASSFYHGIKFTINAYDSYILYQKPITAKAGIKFRTSFISSLMGDQYEQANDYFPAAGFGSEINLDILPHAAHSLTLGAEYKLDGGHSKFIGNHRGYSIAPYIQDQWQLFKNMTITLGLRYDDYRVMNSDYHENYLNPKIGINYTPFESTILRFSGGSGFRAASIFERFIDFFYENSNLRAVPNENLKAETSRSFDIGIRQQVTNNWWIDAAIFNNDYYNYIEPVQDELDDFSLQVQFQNVVRARIQGIEFSTKGSLWHDHLGLNANVTWMDAKDINRNKPLTYRPKLIGFIAPSVKFEPFEFQVEYRYASRIDTVMLYEMDQRVPQKVWTCRVYLRLNQFSAILAINNLFNYAYAQRERNLGKIRNVAVTFMYDL